MLFYEESIGRKTEIEKLIKGEPIGRLQCMKKPERNEILGRVKE